MRGLAHGHASYASRPVESIRHGEGRSRPGLRVLRETAFNKVKFKAGMAARRRDQSPGDISPYPFAFRASRRTGRRLERPPR
eukprot:2548735-Prymnesium_polylepis.1